MDLFQSVCRGNSVPGSQIFREDFPEGGEVRCFFDRQSSLGRLFYGALASLLQRERVRIVNNGEDVSASQFGIISEKGVAIFLGRNCMVKGGDRLIEHLAKSSLGEMDPDGFEDVKNSKVQDLIKR